MGLNEGLLSLSTFWSFHTEHPVWGKTTVYANYFSNCSIVESPKRGIGSSITNNSQRNNSQFGPTFDHALFHVFSLSEIFLLLYNMSSLYLEWLHECPEKSSDSFTSGQKFYQPHHTKETEEVDFNEARTGLDNIKYDVNKAPQYYCKIKRVPAVSKVVLKNDCPFLVLRNNFKKRYLKQANYCKV